LTIPQEADYIKVALYYQGTSREYIEFLQNEINGTSATLVSPTPSGETNAYVVQNDPFFSQLKAWGNTIWDLWYHNHGLDGSGVSVDCIVPFKMTEATLGTPSLPLAADLSGDCEVDFIDFTIFASYWLNDCTVEPCGAANLDNSDNIIDWSDLAVLASDWLR
jgi:hypothetical protein